MISQIDASGLQRAREGELAASVLLDVREAWEFAQSRIDGSVNVPMSVLAGRVEEVRDLHLAAGAPIVVICHHGVRSMQCARFLEAQGIDALINLHGGIDAWSERVDPSVPRY